MLLVLRAPLLGAVLSPVLQHGATLPNKNEQWFVRAFRKFELNENRITGLVAVLRSGATKYAKPKVHLQRSFTKSPGYVIFRTK